jgi:hypothetical protein
MRTTPIRDADILPLIVQLSKTNAVGAIDELFAGAAEVVDEDDVGKFLFLSKK